MLTEENAALKLQLKNCQANYNSSKARLKALQDAMYFLIAIDCDFEKKRRRLVFRDKESVKAMAELESKVLFYCQDHKLLTSQHRLLLPLCVSLVHCSG